MERKKSLLKFLILMLFLILPAFALSGCGGGGGSSSPTPSTDTTTVSGQVMGGLNPIPGVSVNLYVAGDTNPTDTITTNTTGNYSFSYTYSSSSNPILYVVADLSTGHLISVAGSASNMPATVNIDELSTAQTAFAINQASESINSNGSINVKTNGTNLLADFSAVYSATNNTATTSFTPLQYGLYTIANGLASAVQSDYDANKTELAQAYTAAQSLLTNLKAYSSFTCTVSNSYCTEGMALNGVTNGANNNTIAAFSGSAYEIAPQAPYPMAPNTTVDNTLMVSFLSGGYDEPYVTIYINGTPFNLLLDTGATGIMVNALALSSAGVTLPTTNYQFSGSFGAACSSTSSGFSGYISYGQVSTSSTGELSTSSYFPIAVDTTNCNFQGLAGDFGMGLSPYYTFGYDSSSNTQPIFVPSAIYGFSQNYNNGFLLNLVDSNFNTNGYDNSSAAGAGSAITFGLNTETNNMLNSSAVFFPDDGYTLGYSALGYYPEFPLISSAFGTTTIDPATGNNYLSLFDTGSNFMFLGTNALTGAISGFYSSTTVYNCSSNIPVLGYSSTGNWNMLIGGLSLDMYFLSSSGSYLGNTYPTYPAYNGTTDTLNSDSLCGIAVIPSYPFLYEYYVLDGGSQQGGWEDFGLPFMFNQTLYWQISPWGLGED